MKNVLILGAGRFGRIAVERLSRKFPSASITVVDREIENHGERGKRNIQQIASDAIEYLAENLRDEQKGRAPDWIVPAVPLHVAFEWVKLRLLNSYRIEKLVVPQFVTRRFPHVMAGGTGRIYTSVADFICPDDCPEPEKLCTYTGRPRPQTLHQDLEALRQPGWSSVVVRSCQLLPGVGGYRPKDLLQALQAVSSSRAAVLLATACKCHAVIDAFQLRRIVQSDNSA